MEEKLQRSRLIGSGYDFVVFGKGRVFTEDINGKVYWLGQGCTRCDTWIAGEENFTHCPNCGNMIAHAA